MSAVPTGPNSTGAGDLWIAPQDTAACHRPAADTRGGGLAAGHELGGGGASPCWALALGASSLLPIPHLVLLMLTLCSPSLTPILPIPHPVLPIPHPIPHPVPHPSLPARPCAGGRSCRRPGHSSPTTRPRLGERSRSRARSEAVLGWEGWEGRAGPPPSPVSCPAPEPPRAAGTTVCSRRARGARP